MLLNLVLNVHYKYWVRYIMCGVSFIRERTCDITLVILFMKKNDISQQLLWLKTVDKNIGDCKLNASTLRCIRKIMVRHYFLK